MSLRTRTTSPLALAILLALAARPSICLCGPDNIAPRATVQASSEFSKDFPSRNVIDGCIGVDGQGEWASRGRTTFWGFIDYPSITLTWPRKVTIDRVVLYDRRAEEEHTAGGVLDFSDGSRVRTFAIPNDGAPHAVTFPPRKVIWMRFTVTDGHGKNLGLSEIEVFPAPEDDPDAVSWVDPFIETTRGRWFFFVPGSRPFGMISASPYTRNKNQYGGGYNYNSTEILGFAQLHAWELSGINIMPVLGAVDPVGGEQAWKSAFSHDSEIVQPGYYRVFLDRYRTWVEQTCTDRVSLYRFRFARGGDVRVFTSLGGRLGGCTMKNARVKRLNDRVFEGSISTVDRIWRGPEDVKVYFVVEFDRPFAALDGWRGKEHLTGIASLEGDEAGVSARFRVDSRETLHMKVAISYTNLANAHGNLKAECDHWDFDRVRQDARAEWNRWLDRIQVEGGTVAQRIKFYTDLWHVLLGRHKIDDVSGDYPDTTSAKSQGKNLVGGFTIKTLPKDEQGRVKFHMYNSDAFWLTQWNLNILWGLAWPDVLDDFAACLIQYADNGGLLPRGPCVGGYSFIMTGCPATSLIVSAYQKGQLTKVDAEHAFEVMKRNHLPGGMMNVNDHYIEEGFSPGNAGTTIQWAFEDWALAQMARRLGRTADYEYFLKRSSGWKRLYHPEKRLILPKKKDGSWLHTDPLSGRGWVEANAWQGTWSVSHDIAGLAELMGGRDRLCERLNFAFEKAAPTDFVFAYGGGYVSYANQPGCSNAHVFNHAGQPWRSQYWVRRVNEQAYGGITPDVGYGGHDEDQGQMGGVSALMSIGLFSLRGTTAVRPVYEITSPVFDEIRIRLHPRYYAGREFIIRTENNSPENVYIQSARWNGKTHDAFWLEHRQLAAGGLLELTLGSRADKDWGVQALPAESSVETNQEGSTHERQEN